MNGKILIVEDEPIVALDLQQEINQMGYEVVGVAESADEALLAVSACRPDLALMDIRIVGSMDGIQTARLLSSLYGTPSIFLTSYSDEATIARRLRNAEKELDRANEFRYHVVNDDLEIAYRALCGIIESASGMR